MSKFTYETVLSVQHWNETLFSLRCTRDRGLRFINGQFVMLGLQIENKPLMRAYSIASPNYADYLEFLSIKVPNGPLTSRLQHIKVGDCVLVSTKPTGTLIVDDLLPGRNLFLLATGTGLAPFMSIIQDPSVYERFEKLILVHGVRYTSELAYQHFIEQELRQHEFLGEFIRQQLYYYPTVTRDKAPVQGRLTAHLQSGRLCQDLALPAIDSQQDRAMICGRNAMLKDTSKILNEWGFIIAPRLGEPGSYVIERAFVDK